MPSSASRERPQTLAFLGADVVLTPAELGTSGAIEKAHELAEKNLDWCLLDHYSSESNAHTHFETTGPEIWRDAPDITQFVAGIGSGGTLVGVGRFFKQRNPFVAIVAAESEAGHLIVKPIETWPPKAILGNQHTADYG